MVNPDGAYEWVQLIRKSGFYYLDLAETGRAIKHRFELGRLPIMLEVWEEAKARSVELIALPTSQAFELLRSIDESPVNAILHVTC